MFAAFLKLLTPAIVVVPGIIAFHLYKDQISNPDEAYPYLVQNMLPPYLRGILLAALFGAVISSFNAMLNSAATIFTMDFYTRYINPQAAGHKIIRVGRIATGTFLLMAIIWSPMIYFLGEGVFVYIQKFWGFITPGIVSAFIIGMLIKRTPAFSANIAMIMNIPVYGLLLYFLPNVAFLHHMAITFLILSAFMIVATLFKPLKEPVHMPENKDINLDRQPSLYIVGTIVLVLVALLFIVFR